MPNSLNLSCIRMIATDMDGTLTQKNKFTSLLFQAFENLKAAGVKVLIVTGRSAGWVNGLAHYLPIVGAIAENGGLFYPSDSESPLFLTPIPNITTHRQQLAVVFDQLKQQFPKIQESVDNNFRITDWTFDVAGLSVDEIKMLASQSLEMGWGFTYSNVQCHIKPLGQDKAVGLHHVLQEYFPDLTPKQVVTVGDSPNDESLFNTRDFGFSVGVANISHYLDSLQHKPTFITHAAEGEGFCELARMILQQI
ncbi:MAG: HAD family phosphatase [Calothrix sp. C42_A2020_038]|nr:HAD family phosphatase [Calothrix sp. C42_A2020_038]